MIQKLPPGTWSKELKVRSQREIYASMFTVVSFTTAKKVEVT